LLSSADFSISSSLADFARGFFARTGCIIEPLW
jgi:hypothetical protein